MSKITSNGWQLFFKESNLPVFENEHIQHNEEPGWTIAGGEAPRHSSSTGKVWLYNTVTSQSRIFFPVVVACEWRQIERLEVDRRKQ